MKYVSCIFVTATLAGLIAGCGGQNDYIYSSPRYTPGYTPGSSYVSRHDRDRNDNGLHPGAESNFM